MPYTPTASRGREERGGKTEGKKGKESRGEE